jgi:hypothetical protein
MRRRLFTVRATARASHAGIPRRRALRLLGWH